MVHHRVLAHNDFGYRVGEVDGVLDADIAFDNRCLAVRTDEDQVPRIRNRGLCMRGRNEPQLERGLEGHTWRDGHERSVLQKGRVKGNEGLVLITGIASQVRFDRLWFVM